MASWKDKFLSKGGRLILVRYVLSCMHLHILVVTPVLMAVIKQLNAFISNFFGKKVNDKIRENYVLRIRFVN